MGMVPAYPSNRLCIYLLGLFHIRRFLTVKETVKDYVPVDSESEAHKL